MSKISFSKIESVLGETLRKASIEHLKELAAIANLLSELKPKIADKTIEQVLERFQAQLKKLEKHDPKLYARLELSKEERKHFSLSVKDLTAADWEKIKRIQERIEELKKELYGDAPCPQEEDLKRIEAERIKHINKRFNVRDGWLPLK